MVLWYAKENQVTATAKRNDIQARPKQSQVSPQIGSLENRRPYRRYAYAAEIDALAHRGLKVSKAVLAS